MKKIVHAIFSRRVIGPHGQHLNVCNILRGFEIPISILTPNFADESVYSNVSTNAQRILETEIESELVVFPTHIFLLSQHARKEADDRGYHGIITITDFVFNSYAENGDVGMWVVYEISPTTRFNHSCPIQQFEEMYEPLHFQMA